MKKLESTLPNMVMVLTGVTIIAAGLLGVMQQLTKDPIAQIEAETLNNGIKKVMLQEVSVSNIEEVTSKDGKQTLFVYTAEKDGKVIGKAVKTTVNGFSPGLTVLTGFDEQGNILGYEILATSETPGLGSKANTWFQKDGKGNIIGMNPGKNNMTVSKDKGEVDAITSSTITSRAFLRAVNAEYNAIFDGSDANTGATQKAQADSTATAAPDSTAAAETKAPVGGPLEIKVVEVEE